MVYEKMKKPELIKEIDEAKKKVSELTKEVNEEKEKVSELTSELNEEKKKVSELTNELKVTKARQYNLSDKINFLEKERADLEQKLKLKEDKVDLLVHDKESLLKEKSEVLEDKSKILQEIKEKELELQEKMQRFDKLKEKFKQSSSDLLNKTMQIDKLVKKEQDIHELESKIEELEKLIEEGKIRSLEGQKEDQSRIKSTSHDVESLEGTNVISDRKSIIKYIHEMIPQSKSQIRIVLPTIEDLDNFKIIDILKKVPSKVRINIASKIEDPSGNVLVHEIKGFSQLTNCFNSEFIALNVDSAKFLICFLREDGIVGFYTEAMEIIDLFKASIMEPFIKGRKVI